MNVQMDGFRTWLLSEIEKRGWSYRELARRGEISSARITQVLSGEKPGRAFCVGIARAFNISAESVLHRASLLPPVPEQTPGMPEAVHLFTLLNPERRALILTTMRAWVNADYAVDDAEAKP